MMGVLGAVVDVFTDRLAALGRFLINLIYKSNRDS